MQPGTESKRKMRFNQEGLLMEERFGERNVRGSLGSGCVGEVKG